MFEAFDVATRLLGEHGVTPPMSGVIDVEPSGSQSLSSVSLGGDDVFVDWFEQQYGSSALSADLLGWIALGYNPLWQEMGGLFEDVVKGDLDVVSEGFASLAKGNQVGLDEMLRSSVGRGWSGAIDENPLFQRNLLRVTNAFIPDGFYAAAEQRVIPFDLKVNVANAKPGQVSEGNFGRLVEDADCLQTVFSGFTLRFGDRDLLVRGQWAVDEPSEASWDEEDFDPRSLIMSEVLDSEDDRIGDIMKRVAELWSEWDRIGADDLAGLGLEGEQKGLIVDIFNQCLDDRTTLVG